MYLYIIEYYVLIVTISTNFKGFLKMSEFRIVENFA